MNTALRLGMVMSLGALASGLLIAALITACGGPGNEDMRKGVPLPGFAEKQPVEQGEEQGEELRALAAADHLVADDPGETFWNPPDLPPGFKFRAVGKTGNQWDTSAHAMLVKTEDGDIEIWVEDGHVRIRSFTLQSHARVGGADSTIVIEYAPLHTQPAPVPVP